MALTLPSIPMAYSPALSAEPRTRTVSFGDGYALRSPDGLNTVAMKASVSWRALTHLEMLHMVNFFNVHQGVDFFWWTPPDFGTAYKWICPRYNWTNVRDAPRRYDMDAEFQQVHDLGT